MLARGNDDGAERVPRNGERKGEWESDNTSEWQDGDEVARGAATDGGGEWEPTSVTEKRTEKEKTAPKALLYLSYNYHNRAPRRTPPVPTNPTSCSALYYQAATANWKLSNTFSLRCSLARSPRTKLFAVGRRPSSRGRMLTTATRITQSWNACPARGWSTYGH